MNTLYIDTTANALVTSPITPARCLPPVLTVGDTVSLVLAFLQRNQWPLNTGTPVYNYLDFSGSDVVFTLGNQQAQPTSGTFPLAWSTDTFQGLAWNISSYALSAALNAGTAITAAGGVSVTGPIGGPFVVTFVTNGAQVAFTSGANSLFPGGAVTITQGSTGTGANPSIQNITLAQSALATVSAWTAQASAAVTVASLESDIIQRITIPAGTYGGTFTLTTNGNTTVAIPFNAQIDLMASAIGALPGCSGVTVAAGQNYWDITIPAWTHAFTGSATGLQIPLTLTGSLALTAPAVLAALAGCPAAAIPFSVQTTASGVQTILSGTIPLVLP